MQEEKYYFDLQKVPLKTEREEKRQNRKRLFLTFLIALFCLIAGVGIGFILFKYVHPSYKADASNVMGEIEYDMSNYWLYSSEHDDMIQEMEDKAFYGMTSFAEDPYTSYMSVEEMDAFSTGINMNYVGIGVEYSNIDDVAIVKKVFKKSPAEKAGILPGDIIISVDGKLIKGLSTSEIKELVVGKEGTRVLIKVNRSGEEKDIMCIRGQIDSTIYAYTENDYVVMELNSFGVTTASECVKYLDEYQHLNKIIIDIRDNTGGYQNSVREVCGLFIGNDQVYLLQKDVKGVITEDHTSAKKHYDNFKDIVIITNSNTASAAEVFALCLKEVHPGVRLLGTTTFGKGVIQTNRPLNNGGILKMTQYYWLSPNGTSIDNEGIKPDIEVKQADIAYEHYYQMQEGESLGFDSVSEYTRIAQLSLEYLDYNISRTDGYFDKGFEEALLKYKQDYDLGSDALLDDKTYKSIVSSVIRELSINPEKDYQLVKAKEIISGN